MAASQVKERTPLGTGARGFEGMSKIGKAGGMGRKRVCATEVPM